jgi:NADPH-dependent 2,4-dienoyl-CoA reductase/sulfur reductase-like enzyme
VEIAVFDRGPYVAFANCGLPYYVGDVIADERTLLVASPEMFRERFNVEVHTNTDVIGIDRPARTIGVRDLHTGNSRTERYDALVLSPGAAPIRPPLPGVDLPGVFAVRNIPDSRRIRSWISDRRATTAVVVGGGFIRFGDGPGTDPSRALRDRAGKAAAGRAPARSWGRGPRSWST